MSWLPNSACKFEGWKGHLIALLLLTAEPTAFAESHGSESPDYAPRPPAEMAAALPSPAIPRTATEKGETPLLSTPNRLTNLPRLRAEELKVLLQNMEKRVEAAAKVQASSPLEFHKNKLVSLKEMRAQIEEELYPGPLAAIYREYRDRKPLDPDLKYQKWLFDLISPEELDALRKERSALPKNSARGAEIIKQFPEIVASAAKEIKESLPFPVRARFDELFQPVVLFDDDGGAKITFVPSPALQIAQAKERIALSSFQIGHHSEGNLRLGRLAPLTLTRNPEQALNQLIDLENRGLSGRNLADLVLKHSSSRGVERTGDFGKLLELISGSGLVRYSVQSGIRNYGAKKVTEAALTGGAFGVGIDVALQAAENFDQWRQGKPLHGFDPFRAAQSGALGAALGPAALGRPLLVKGLAGAGVVDSLVRASQGDYASAVVSGAAAALPFYRPKPAIGDAVVADLHLAVKRTPTGEVILDSEHISYQYLKGFVKAINEEGKQIGKIFFNGDVVDAPSLKAAAPGAVSAKLKADLIADVIRYIEVNTGKKVEVGMGNHESIKDSTGRYRGDEVAALLSERGITVYAKQDIEIAKVRLTSLKYGPREVELVHKITNMGENLAAILPEGTVGRVLPDVVTTGNPLAGEAVSGKITSDIHQPVRIIAPHSTGSSRRFEFANTGAVNGEVNSALVVEGFQGNAVGTFLVVQPTRSGIETSFRLLVPGESGGIIPERLTDISNTWSIPFAGGGQRYPLLRFDSSVAPILESPSSNSYLPLGLIAPANSIGQEFRYR